MGRGKNAEGAEERGGIGRTFGGPCKSRVQTSCWAVSCVRAGFVRRRSIDGSPTRADDPGDGDRKLVVPGLVRGVHRRRGRASRAVRGGRSRGGAEGRGPPGGR